MRTRIPALVFAALCSTGCTNTFQVQHLDGGQDGGLGAGAFSLFTLDTSTLPDGGSANLPATVPQLAMAVRADDTVGIAFFAPNGTSGSGVQLYDIRYMEWKGGIATAPETVTNVQNVNGLALAFQPPGGEPALAFLGGAYPSPGSPFWAQANGTVAYHTGGSWQAPDVVVTSSAEAFCGNTVSDNGVVLGLDPALAFIQGQAQLVYRDVHYGQSIGTGDYKASDLELAYGAPGGWSHQPIDCGGNDKMAYGGHTQMVVTGDGLAALVQDQQFQGAEVVGQNVLFRKQTSLTAWARPTTEPFADLGPGVLSNTLSGPTLAFDAQLGYAVAVFNGSTNTLYYTESQSPLTQWNTSDPVVNSGSQGWYPSLAIDPNQHQPSIAYAFCSATAGKAQSDCSQVESQLRLATRVGNNWSFQVVDPAGGFVPRLAFLSTGKRVVVYRDPFSGYLKLAVEN